MSSFRERFDELDRQYWLKPKILFITMNLAYYSSSAFRPDYLYETHGIETREYALIAAILSLIIFFGGYFWSYLADRAGSFRTMLLITTVSSALIFQLFLFYFPVDYRIMIVTFITAFYIFFGSAMTPLLDALVMEILNSFPGDNKAKYGRQRMFGTVACALIQIILGIPKHLRPMLNIVILVFSGFFVVVVMIFLPKTAHRKPKRKDLEMAKDSKVTVPPVAKTKCDDSVSMVTLDVSGQTEKEDIATVKVVSQQDTRSPIIRLMTNGNFLFLLLIALMYGIAKSMMTHFVRPIQKNVFDTPKWTSGISFAVGVALEIPILFFAEPLAKKFGPRKMLLMAQAAMVVRISLYAFLPRKFPGSKFIPLVYELFKGLSGGCMQAVAVVWVSEIAPPGLKSTAQSIYSGVYSGLSAFAAGMIGWMVQSIGAEHHFKNPTEAQKRLLAIQKVERSSFLLCLTAYFSMFSLAVFFIKYIVIDGIKAKKSGRSETDFDK